MDEENLDMSIFDGIEFDFNDLMSYQGIVESLNNSKLIQDMDIGDPTTLVWNYDFLMTTMQLVGQGHREDLEKMSDYSSMYMMIDFIHDAACYALINNRGQVDRREIINTFKDWEYLPFWLRLSIVDDLFDQEHIPYKEHPFRNKRPINKSASRRQITGPQKVIKFNPKKEKD